MYYLLGFLTIVIISLLTALIVVALSAKKGENFLIIDSLYRLLINEIISKGSNDNKICESEECVRSGQLRSKSIFEKLSTVFPQ